VSFVASLKEEAPAEDESQPAERASAEQR